MAKLTQPSGSVIHDIEKNTISKILGIDVEKIEIVSTGLSVDNFSVLIEPVSGKYFDCTESLGQVISFDVSGDVLVLNTTENNYELNSLSLQSSAGASYIGTSTNLGGGGIYSVQDVLDSVTTYQFPSDNSIKRPLNDKLSEYVSVLDFGADPSGITPSDEAFEKALLYSKSITLPQKGRFLITRPIKYYSQCSIRGESAQGRYNDSSHRAQIYAKRPVEGDLTTWQGGDYFFEKINPEQQYQSIKFENIHLLGWADINYSELSTSEDIGVDNKYTIK